MDKNIPFKFVFDYLEPLDVTVKPMFGMFAVYVGEKIMLVLRKRKSEENKNGVWIACSNDDDVSLRAEFPSLRSIPGLTNKSSETEWQYFPDDADDFETSVIRICELIVQRDSRIRRVPQNRVPKKKSKR